MIVLKNYNKFSNSKEKPKVKNANFKEKIKEKMFLMDQAENIKDQIKEQEEKIQTLKNSISIYFVDKCKFVNIREKQNKDSIVIKVLENGTLIEPVIYNDTTEWTKVNFSDKGVNKTGYIMTKYIGVEVSTPTE